MMTNRDTTAERVKPNTYFWQGLHITLRPLQESDWDILYAEEHDSEGIRQLEAGIQLPRSPERTQATIHEWMERNNKDDESSPIMFMIEAKGVEDTAGAEGMPHSVGMAVLHSRNPRNGTFSFAIRTFTAHRGRGYAREAIWVLLRYGFEELRYQKANSVTVSSNEASIQLHLALGFQIEGRIRRNVYTGGQYHDEVLFGMTREEYDALVHQKTKETE